MLIESMGIEVRKIGTMNSLYREVDMILSKTMNIAAMTVAHGLQKMLSPEKWVDVSFIKEASTMCGIFISAERLKIYGCVHCMNWSQMLPEYRAMIMAMILDDFRSVLNPECKEVV